MNYFLKGVPVKLDEGRKRVAVRRRRPSPSTSNFDSGNRGPFSSVATAGEQRPGEQVGEQRVRGSVPLRPVEQGATAAAANR